MVIPAGFAQVTLVYGGLSAPLGAANVLGIDPTGSPLDPGEVAESVGNDWIQDIMPSLSDQLILEKAICKFGPDDTGPSGEFIFNSSGGNTDDAASPNCTYLFRKNTLLGGRKGRGRLYCPGVIENALTATGSLQGTILTDLTSGMNSFLFKTATDNLPVVLLHGDGTTPTALESMTLQAVAATQRRRMRK